MIDNADDVSHVLHKVAGKTDVGCKRSSNQDAFGISRIAEGLLVVVADGMGGFKGGEVASQIAVDCFLDEVPRRLIEGDITPYAMSGAGNVAHCGIRLKAAENSELEKMGTTLVAVLMENNAVNVVNAGDSRCYLYQNERLIQVTRDHTVAQEMMDGGALTEEQMEASPYQHILSNSLGAGNEIVHFAYSNIGVAAGDRLLLCTDGLTNAVSDEEISGIIGNVFDDVDTCAANLIERSLVNRTTDNVTVVVIEVRD